MKRSTAVSFLCIAAIASAATLGVGDTVQVQADTEASVAVEGGGASPLTVEETPRAGRYVEATTSEGTESVKIELGGGGDSLGLNPNAATTISPILEVTNRGSESFEVGIKDGGTEDGLEFFNHRTGKPIEDTVVDPSEDGKSSVQIGVKVRPGELGDHDAVSNREGSKKKTVTLLAEATR